MRYREEILDFLYSHRGWIKKSPKDLVARLENLKMPTNIADVKKLQAEARQKIKYSHPNDSNAITQDMKVRRVWFTPGGKMGVSYETDVKEEQENTVYEAIQKLIEKGVTPYKVENNERSNNDLILNVYSADKHIGARTPSHSMYSNPYDEDEIYNRHRLLVERLAEQKKRFGKFKMLNLFELGDAIDGINQQTTRGGHILPQNMDNREQIDCFINVTIWFFESLFSNDLANEYSFIATSNDNHSGAAVHGALRAIQMYLEARYDNVTVKISDKMLDHVSWGNHTFIFGHGKDDSDRKFGLPLNLNDKTENFINNYIDRKGLKNDHIHVIKGDLHQSSENYGKRFRYKNNMSMYGASKWIHSNFGSGNAGVNYEVIDIENEEVYSSRLTYGHDS